MEALQAAETGIRNVAQMIWDPEPSNDTARNLPVWCLGKSYRLGPRPNPPPAASKPDLEDHGSPTVAATPPPSTAASTPAVSASSAPAQSQQEIDQLDTKQRQKPDTPPESISSSFDSSLAYEELPNSKDGGWPSAFLDDVESRIWMTYRSEFDVIPKSRDPQANSALSLSMRLTSPFSNHQGFSSDTGWGCMIRTGQCLLANAKAFYSLGRDWRRSSDRDGELDILAAFADDKRAPYSIHNFVRHGSEACGKYPGEWFGPSATARCITALANAHEPTLRVYSTGDGNDVYADSFMQTAKVDDAFHPTIILVSTRLGLDKITPVYWEALIASLQLPQSIGIAGGRPSSSLYFFGAQGQHLFYLDPHKTRLCLPYNENSQNYTEEEVDSCHTRRLRRIHVKELDPSMLIGFLIRDETDWLNWREAVVAVQGKAVINVADHDPSVGGGAAFKNVETLSDDDEDTILDV